MQSSTTASVSRVPAGTGNRYNVIGEQVTLKVTQAETDGTATVAELLAQPGGGPPLHTHTSAEIFNILDGEFEFTHLEDGAVKTFRATAGDTVYVPSGTAHTYKAVGDRPGRTTVVFTPGLDMESFFMEAGTRITDGETLSEAPPDIPAMIAIAQKHGMGFLPPASA